MQRRLTLALVLITLVSIVFVGLGVLAMAQLTARSNAERDVSRRLEAVSELSAGSGQRFDSVREILGSTRADLGLDLLDVVVVNADRSVDRFEPGGRRGRPRPARSGFRLEPDQPEAIDRTAAGLSPGPMPGDRAVMAG